MHFDSPYMFLLMLLIPVLVVPGIIRRRGTVSFSSIAHALRAGKSLRQRLSVLPIILRVLALICIIIALARPQKGLEQIRDINHGIAVEMVLDRSGSMRTPMKYRGEELNRLEVVKRVFEEFVIGNKKDLEGRPSDLVGLITFAKFSETVAPLTLAHDALPDFLKTIKLPVYQAEDGTAIGDGLALAAARLKTAEETLAKQTENDKGMEYEIKSKIIILLTDGENNAGQRSPMQAAALAAEWGIKVYTIGVGRVNETVNMQTPFGTYQTRRAGVDFEGLKAISSKTGGIFRRAEDAESLHEIYREINELEKSEIESLKFVDYKEQFLPIAIAALVLLLIEVTLSCTVFRKVP